MTYKKESPIRSIASVPSSIQPQHKPGSRPASPATPRAAIVIIAVSPLLHSREFGSNTPIPQATAAGTSDVSLNDDGDVSFTDSSRADSGLRVSSSSIANSDSNYDDAFDDDYPSALQDSHEFGQFSFDLIGEDTLRASLATLTPVALTASSDSISNSSDSSEGTTGDLTWDNSDDSLIDSSDSTSAVLGPLPHWWGEEDHDHVKTVISYYEQALHLNRGGKSVRAARPFVGRVVRHQLPSVDRLQTIDEVFVYLYDLVPFGQEMPFHSLEYVLTTWDEASGLPVHQLAASSIMAQCIWLPKAHESNYSSLFCEPDASQPSLFVYTADNEHNRRSDVSIGYFSPQFQSWSRFCPITAFHVQPLED